MKMKTNWTGLRGLEQEDAVISLSMGPIFDRSKEHLVAADRAVMRLRRRILDNIKLVQNGEEPLGVNLADLSTVGNRSHGANRDQLSRFGRAES